jgi:hypothetical protein
MTNLEKRVAKMEQAADDVDLKSMWQPHKAE